MAEKIKFHAKQIGVLQDKARFILAKAGIRGGKTTVGAHWLCAEIWKAYQAEKKGDWLVAAPTFKILQQSSLPTFRSVIPQDWGQWRESRQCFELVWGNYVYFRSTDNPDSLEGMTLLGAWLDEAGQTKKDTWVNIQGRLSIAKGRLLMTTTPYGDGNWTNKAIYQTAGKINGVVKKDGDKDIAIYEWESVENPAFPRDEYERARATLDPAVFRRRYQGVFTRLEGLVYSDFKDEFVVDPFDVPHGWERFGGMDFGKTNPTAIICLAEDPTTNIFYLYKEFYRSETPLKMAAGFVKDQGLRYVLADPQSAQLILELNRQYGLGNVQAADNDINVGIERVNTLIRAGRLRVFKTCDNTIEEMTSYHYGRPDEDGYVKDKPVAKNNHAMDALRYALSKNMDVKRIYSPGGQSTSRKKLHGMSVLRRSDMVADIWTGYV